MSSVGLLLMSLLLLWMCGVPCASALGIRCSTQGYLEGRYAYIYCDTHTTDSRVTWTLVADTGSTLDLGSCDGLNDCQTPHSSDVDLTRSSITNNYIRLYNIRRQAAGTLICTESFEGRTYSDNCTVRVHSAFQSCSDVGREVQENNDISWSCQVSNSSRPITWTLVALEGNRTQLGICYSLNNCTTSSVSGFSITRQSTAYSYVYVNDATRDMAGTLVCSDGMDTSTCTLDVYGYVSYDSCSIQVQKANWTVTGTCKITKMYSSIEHFGFRFYQYWLNLYSRTTQTSYLTDRVPFTATAYTDLRGILYYRGSYTYSWPLPSQDGYYYYTAYTYPGGNTYSMYEGFLIENPRSPAVSCVDLLQSGPASCVCSTPSVGLPAGRLLWLSGDTVLAVGQYGATELHLSSSVTVGNTTLTLTCQLDWVIKHNTSVILPPWASYAQSSDKPSQTTSKPAQNTAQQCLCTTQSSDQSGAQSGAQSGDQGGDSGLLLGVAVGGYVGLAVLLAVLVVFIVVAFRRRRAGPATPTATQKEGHAEAPVHDYSQFGARRGRDGPDSIYENPNFCGED